MYSAICQSFHLLWEVLFLNSDSVAFIGSVSEKNYPFKIVCMNQCYYKITLCIISICIPHQIDKNDV